MPPTMGKTMNTQSCASAQPPTNSAGASERAGFTEVLVTGMLIRWMSVSVEADGQRREARGRAPVRHPVDDEQEGEGEQQSR